MSTQKKKECLLKQTSKKLYVHLERTCLGWVGLDFGGRKWEFTAYRYGQISCHRPSSVWTRLLLQIERCMPPGHRVPPLMVAALRLNFVGPLPFPFSRRRRSRRVRIPAANGFHCPRPQLSIAGPSPSVVGMTTTPTPSVRLLLAESKGRRSFEKISAFA